MKWCNNIKLTDFQSSPPVQLATVNHLSSGQSISPVYLHLLSQAVESKSVFLLCSCFSYSLLRTRQENSCCSWRLEISVVAFWNWQSWTMSAAQTEAGALSLFLSSKVWFCLRLFLNLITKSSSLVPKWFAFFFQVRGLLEKVFEVQSDPNFKSKERYFTDLKKGIVFTNTNICPGPFLKWKIYPHRSVYMDVVQL